MLRPRYLLRLLLLVLLLLSVYLLQQLVHLLLQVVNIFCTSSTFFSRSSLATSTFFCRSSTFFFRSSWPASTFFFTSCLTCWPLASTFFFASCLVWSETSPHPAANPTSNSTVSTPSNTRTSVIFASSSLSSSSQRGSSGDARDAGPSIWGVLILEALRRQEQSRLVGDAQLRQERELIPVGPLTYDLAIPHLG